MPLVKLGDHFAHIQDYLERVPNGIPDILQLEHLTVAGDVIFGANVTLKVGGSGLLLPCLDCDERTVLLPGPRWMRMSTLWLGWLTLPHLLSWT